MSTHSKRALNGYTYLTGQLLGSGAQVSVERSEGGEEQLWIRVGKREIAIVVSEYLSREVLDEMVRQARAATVTS